MDNVVEKLPPENIQPLRDSSLAILDGETQTPKIFINPILQNSTQCNNQKWPLDDEFFPRKTAGELEHLDAFLLNPVLTATECDNLITASETVGLSYWDESRTKSHKIRACKTIECQLPELTESIWRRIGKSFAGYPFDSRKLHHELHGSLLGEWVPSGLNPHVLISRYDPGDHFAPHVDGSCDIDVNHHSFFSVILYLNTVKSGGGTAFFDRAVSQQEVFASRAGNQPACPLKYAPTTTHEPMAGQVLFFEHNLLHEGIAVGEGSVKYIVRTDLMFARKHTIFQSLDDRQALALMKEAQRLECAGDTESSLRLLMRVRRVSPAVAEMFGLM